MNEKRRREMQRLVDQGFAYWYQGRLIPVIRGGDGRDEGDEPESQFAGTPFADFADIPEDLTALTDEALADAIGDFERAIGDVASTPLKYVSADFTKAQLLDATKLAAETLKSLKAETDRRASEAELTDDEAAEFAAFAKDDDGEGDDEGDAGDGDGDDAGDGGEEAAAEETVTAAAPRARRAGLPRPTADRQPRETEPAGPPPVQLVATGGARDTNPGTPYASEMDLAQAMIRRHDTFGQAGPEVVETFSIAKADWRDQYPADRKFKNNDEDHNWQAATPIIDPSKIKAELRLRKHEMAKTFKVDGLVASGYEDVLTSLVASGGLCAPVTPYYNLQYISVPVRPVMGSLPSFMADRGGLRYARPAGLSAVTTAVGIVTEAEDQAGGSSAEKTCQVIPCPTFFETDVDIIYHCLQFGNLGARTFPELVAQWNNLVLAAHARLAESNLLTLIDAASTQVTAGSLGLGASASLLNQILVAANGLRSRNRMDPEAVLRLMLPWWSVDLIVSDVIRTQFQRFDTDHARVIALLRSFNIEPTFYIDGANGRNQVFGTQGAGALMSFPDHVVWYLFPEGSFLYLDSGTLELGIVRDSVLNKTNDFQIFGETFESVAFVGIESLAVSSHVCDTGVVSAPATGPACPINYNVGS